MRLHGLPRLRQCVLIIEDILGVEGKIFYIFLRHSICLEQRGFIKN